MEAKELHEELASLKEEVRITHIKKSEILSEMRESNLKMEKLMEKEWTSKSKEEEFFIELERLKLFFERDSKDHGPGAYVRYRNEAGRFEELKRREKDQRRMKVEREELYLESKNENKSNIERLSLLIDDVNSKLDFMDGEVKKKTKDLNQMISGMSNLELFKSHFEGINVDCEVKNRITGSKRTAFVVHSSYFRNARQIEAFETLKQKKKLFRVTENMKYCFISHKWYDSEPDDEEGSLLNFLKELPDGYYWLDYCCIAQQSIEEKQEMLKSIPDLIKGDVILFPGNSDYQRSVWCAYESVHRPDLNISLWDDMLPLTVPEDAGFIGLSVINVDGNNLVAKQIINFITNHF